MNSPCGNHFFKQWNGTRFLRIVREFSDCGIHKSCDFRMMKFQTEVNHAGGTSRTGVFSASVGGYFIKRLVNTFHFIGF